MFNTNASCTQFDCAQLVIFCKLLFVGEFTVSSFATSNRRFAVPADLQGAALRSNAAPIRPQHPCSARLSRLLYVDNCYTKERRQPRKLGMQGAGNFGVSRSRCDPRVSSALPNFIARRLADLLEIGSCPLPSQGIALRGISAGGAKHRKEHRCAEQ